jgi:glycosidase
VRQEQPGFLFIAEVYWDLEGELQQLGFDFCYDKRLYDRLVYENAESVHLHLLAVLPYQEKLVRFIENHDEPRAAATFSFPKLRAAAVTIATLPGAKLFHQGQFEGCKVQLPVQLGRRPAEMPSQEILAFYRQLLRAIQAPAFRQGEWQLCQRNGWPDAPSSQDLVAWGRRTGAERYLMAVNLSDMSAQGLVRLPWDDLHGKTWRLVDDFTRESLERDGGQMVDSGLDVSLEPWGFRFWKIAEAASYGGIV